MSLRREKKGSRKNPTPRLLRKLTQMKMKTKAIAIKQDNSVDSFITKAIEANAPVETMERLFDLQRKWQADQARAAFVQAKATFQGDCPVIKKTKKVLNRDGKTVRYMYAPIDSVIEQIKKPIAENGLSYAWDVIKEGENMKVTCTLTHVKGHSETSTFEIPIVASEFMTSPQSYATAQTYAKRYTLLNVLGIGTAEEDTDANDTGHEKDAKSTKSKIVFRLKALGKSTETKEEVEEAVKKLTSLDLKEENYGEIADRLQVLVAENANA